MINKDFNPVEVWNKAMDKLAEKNRQAVIENEPAETIESKVTIADEFTIHKEVKLTPSEAAKRTAAKILADNPNYFKELSAKSHAKKQEMKRQVSHEQS
jgi:hypothetical protein